MRRIAMAAAGVMVLTLALGGTVIAAGKLELSDAYLSTFTKNFGPGTVNSVLDLDGKGVGFALSGLTNAGTGVSDNFPLSAASGCTASIFPGIFSDCSAYSKLSIKFKNLGTKSVHVNVYMNSGFTAGGSSCPVQGLTCDVYWQGPWTEVRPGKTQVVTLDFSNAEAFNCDGVATDGCINGPGQPILRLNEVTNIAIQVADFTGGPTDTWLVVDGLP